MSRVSDLLEAALPAGWTGQGLSRAAQDRGYTLSATTVLSYVAGTHGRPSSRVLRAFADLLDLDIHQLEEAAAADARTAEDHPGDDPSEDPDVLPPRERAAVRAIVDLLLERRPTVGLPRLARAERPGAQPTHAELLVVNRVVDVLTEAQAALETLGESAFAEHLGMLSRQLLDTFGRVDLGTVEITLPSAQPGQAARPGDDHPRG